jgi:hypothetical protein
VPRRRENMVGRRQGEEIPENSFEIIRAHSSADFFQIESKNATSWWRC